jgi:hypothetical protein
MERPAQMGLIVFSFDRSSPEPPITQEKGVILPLMAPPVVLSIILPGIE